eukprot:scaffold9726_cov119-Isochrysis_galbana.AAC.32
MPGRRAPPVHLFGLKVVPRGRETLLARRTCSGTGGQRGAERVVEAEHQHRAFRIILCLEHEALNDRQPARHVRRDGASGHGELVQTRLPVDDVHEQLMLGCPLELNPNPAEQRLHLVVRVAAWRGLRYRHPDIHVFHVELRHVWAERHHWRRQRPGVARSEVLGGGAAELEQPGNGAWQKQHVDKTHLSLDGGPRLGRCRHVVCQRDGCGRGGRFICLRDGRRQVRRSECLDRRKEVQRRHRQDTHGARHPLLQQSRGARK